MSSMILDMELLIGAMEAASVGRNKPNNDGAGLQSPSSSETKLAQLSATHMPWPSRMTMASRKPPVSDQRKLSSSTQRSKKARPFQRAFRSC